MRKWEYKSIWFFKERYSSSEEDDFLNEQGIDGWEMTCFVSDTNGYKLFYFKRELIEKPADRTWEILDPYNEIMDGEGELADNAPDEGKEI